MVITIEKLVRLDANYMHAFLGKKDGPKETKTPRANIKKTLGNEICPVQALSDSS